MQGFARCYCRDGRAALELLRQWLIAQFHTNHHVQDVMQAYEVMQIVWERYYGATAAATTVPINQEELLQDLTHS